MELDGISTPNGRGSEWEGRAGLAGVFGVTTPSERRREGIEKSLNLEEA
jgi:hypothetical protein